MSFTPDLLNGIRTRLDIVERVGALRIA